MKNAKCKMQNGRTSLECGGSTPLWSAAARHRFGSRWLGTTLPGAQSKAASSRRSPKLAALLLAVVVSIVLPARAEQSAIPVISQTISVSDAVAIALKNNPMISARAAEAGAARARIGMARAMTRPQVTTTTFGTTGTMTNLIPSSPTVGPGSLLVVPDKGQFDQNFMAMYPLYTGGRLRSQVRSAGELAGAAASDVRSSQLDVALDAKVAYRRALVAREFVKAYQRRVDESKERVRIAEESFKEGKIAKYDLLRNQTELADAEQLLVNAQRDVDVAQVDLKAVLGISQSSELTLSGELEHALSPSTSLRTSSAEGSEPAEGTLQDLESRALRQRPEAAAAHARIEAADAGVSVAKSAYKPQVYAVAMQDFARMSGGDGFDQGFTVGVTASIPILDGGLRKSAVNESRAMLERMRAEERDVVLAIDRDVGTAWSELGAASRNVTLSKAAVEQAEEDYRVIKLRYDSGKAINVEVLDGLASLTRAQTNYAQALFDYNIARDRLTRAVGEL